MAHLQKIIVQGSVKSMLELYGITDPTGLVLLLDDAYESGGVSTWKDLSSRGNDLVQDTAGNQAAIVDRARVFDGSDFLLEFEVSTNLDLIIQSNVKI